MTSAQIFIDGTVDLIDGARPKGQTDADADRARSSRLNDIMILLEREQAELQQSLAGRLKSGSLAGGIDQLTIHLDERAPRFHVAIQPAKTDEMFAPPNAGERGALEAGIAAEIMELIKLRASATEKPRWQPRVTATYRVPAAEAAKQKRLKSVWLQAVFILLALIILGGFYLYHRGAPV